MEQWRPMRCLRCYSDDCAHAQADRMHQLSMMQQGMNMQNSNGLQYLAMLQGQAAQAYQQEIVKASSAPPKKKKLLLLRK